MPATPEEETRLADLRRRLLAVRDKRVRPGLDDKVLADWNGMMIAALVNAGVHFDEPSWLQMAARAFLFIDGKMSEGRPARPFLARRSGCCSPGSRPTTPT